MDNKKHFFNITGLLVAMLALFYTIKQTWLQEKIFELEIETTPNLDSVKTIKIGDNNEKNHIELDSKNGNNEIIVGDKNKDNNIIIR